MKWQPRRGCAVPRQYCAWLQFQASPDPESEPFLARYEMSKFVFSDNNPAEQVIKSQRIATSATVFSSSESLYISSLLHLLNSIAKPRASAQDTTIMDLFSPRYKLKIHVLQVLLIVAVIGLSVPRLFMKGQPRTRANTIALGMGAKSLIIISYQVLTEHVNSCRRWASLKANAILNGLEIVFWAAVVFLIIQANISICLGVGCTLSWVVVGVAIVLSVLAFYTAIVSYREFRRSRKTDHLEGATVVRGDGEDGLSLDSSPKIRDYRRN